MKLYLVAKGSYSDYHLKGVFSTEDLAKEACKLYGNDCEIEHYTLNEMPEHPPGLYPFYVNFNYNGELDEVSPIDCTDIKLGYHKEVEIVHGSIVRFCIWASDRDHAIKIAADKRREMIANKHWIGDRVFIKEVIFK